MVISFAIRSHKLSWVLSHEYYIFIISVKVNDCSSVSVLHQIRDILTCTDYIEKCSFFCIVYTFLFGYDFWVRLLTVLYLKPCYNELFYN